MADPTLQTFCCVDTNDTRPGVDILVHFRSDPYNVVCMTFSICGILGAVYQILPRRDSPFPGNVRRQSISHLRSRYIIVWLATADLLASIAVLIRSISWLAGKNLFDPTSATSYSLDTIFCAVSSGWIQYFYTATCIWTLCYAIDVFKVVHENKGMPKIYHLMAWGLPALVCIIGLTTLYFPDLNCHSMTSNPFTRILPNYALTYFPILTVMIVNPLLYWNTSQRAEELVVSISGRFTANERKHLRTLRLKFLCINLVFYVCWIPNIINAFLLWTQWADLPRNFVLVVWYLMAILNPLQAFFNALVYRKWGDSKVVVIFPWTKWGEKAEIPSEGVYLMGASSSSRSSSNSNSNSLDTDEDEGTSKSGSFNGYGSL